MALLETELVVLGRLLSVVVQAQQVAVLDMMCGAVRGEVSAPSPSTSAFPRSPLSGRIISAVAAIRSGWQT